MLEFLTKIKKNIRCLGKLFLHSTVNFFFIRKKRPYINKSIMVIRLDLIGDYLLFRNFLKILREDSAYKDYHITLVGNIRWKSLFESLDKAYADASIFIDPLKFHFNPFYRYQALKKISQFSYEIVIVPTFSRFDQYDNIVRNVCAKRKIAFDFHCAGYTNGQKALCDSYYTELISHNPKTIFEFYRNKEFFEKFLGRKLDILKPTLQTKKMCIKFNLPHKYAVVAIGASSITRRYKPQNVAAAAKYIKQFLGFDIVLVGSKSDNFDKSAFESAYGSKDFCNLIGETTLPELITVIDGAELLLANDSSAFHFGMLLNTKKVVCLSGGHMRFCLYPSCLAQKCRVVFVPEIEKYCDTQENIEYLAKKYSEHNPLDINSIKLEKVIKALQN